MMNPNMPPKSGMDAPAEGGGMEQSPEEVASQHGPADHLEITSHHKDGHRHTMHHHHPDSAHQHVDAAMGGGHSEPEGDEGGEQEHGGFEAVPMAR